MKEKINALIDQLMFVQNKELRKIMLENYIKKNGPIPEEYKDAVDAVMEV